jgi:hypothetical protein
MKKSTGTATQETSENSAARNLNHETIATRAYELWTLRGSPVGSPEVDWLQAEAELSHEPQAAAMISQAA